MTQIQQFEGVDHAVFPAGPLHLAIGIFDGVHLGHRQVIEPAVQAARRDGGRSAVLTFAPHPSVLLRPDHPTQLVMNRAAKARVLAELGVDAVITQPFTADFAQIAPQEFLPWLKERLPQLVAIHVGENWRFGRGRSGDVALLAAAAGRWGGRVFSAPRVQARGEPISSSRIRALLAEGEVAVANALLGYPYFAEGMVVRGKQLGRTIGVPTLNLVWEPDFRPRFGVYGVRVLGAKNSAPLKGVANYGLRPTVELSLEPRIEVHVLGSCPYDAGDAVRVEWLSFLRPEKRFSDLPELRAQIARDIETAAGLTV